MLPDQDHENYNCTAVDSTGQRRQIYANWLHNTAQDYWYGWHCDAGATRFYIDKNFDIWSGECKNQHLGNVLDQWNPVVNAVCQRFRCTGCTDDLMTKKYQKENDAGIS